MTIIGHRISRGGSLPVNLGTFACVVSTTYNGTPCLPSLSTHGTWSIEMYDGKLYSGGSASLSSQLGSNAIKIGLTMPLVGYDNKDQSIRMVRIRTKVNNVAIECTGSVTEVLVTAFNRNGSQITSQMGAWQTY